MTNENKQQQAIEKTQGPTIILAGAGTGKSYTLKKKAKYLINEQQLYDPEEVLCLTFSNEATNSLRNGMREELQTKEDVTVRTFHAFCSDILKEKGHLIGIPEEFELLMPDDAKLLLHKHLNIKPYWANRYVSTISNAKDFGVTLDNIKEHVNTLKEQLLETTTEDNFDNYEREARMFLQTFHLLDKEEQKQQKATKKKYGEFVEDYGEYNQFNKFLKVWGEYDRLKQEHGYLDFSDLNELTLQLFNQFGSEEYTQKYKYVFVDEFQDTNKLQFRLLEYIAAHKNITIVGDPNQSIYGFRGAFKDSFEHFKKIFEADENCIFKLDKSYRSTNTILNIAYELIKNNYENKEECVYVKNANDIEGEPVTVISTINADEEARYIADTVQKKIDEGIPLEKICILHRTHKQAERIKEALEFRNIPVITAGRTNMLQRPEIKTATAYLAMLTNIKERSGTGEQAWWYLFHYHNTIPVQDSIQIGRYLKKANYDKPIEEQESIDSLLLTAADKLNLSKQSMRVVRRIATTLQQLANNSNKSLPELILDIYELTGLNRAFSYKRSIEHMESMLNLKKFYELATTYYELHDQGLEDFINYVEMIDNLGVEIEASKIMNINAVKLMTIHASKGLEFDTVIVSNMAHDRFPVTRTRNEPLIPKEMLPDFKAQIQSLKEQGYDEKAIEKEVKNYDKTIMLLEERRLCYVAWTRAENNLILTFASDYKGEPDSTMQSEFLDEISFKENNNIIYTEDTEEKGMHLSHQSPYEKELSALKKQIVTALDTESYDEIKHRITTYISCKQKRSQEGADEEDIKKVIAKSKEQRIISFDPTTITFSPTGLSTYKDCPKRYELSKIYNMPERGDFELEGGGATIGSFIHEVCEQGVNERKQSLDGFKKIARELHKKEYREVDIEQADSILEVFWERNKHKITDQSITEIKLNFTIDGYRFFGIADRVDILEDGSVEVIDYKTNKSAIKPEKRALQLGFYALALQEKGYKVKRLTLDMLRLDKPIEMEVDTEGNVTSVTGGTKKSNFNLQELKQEIIKYCNSIAHDYEHGFKVTDDENNCRFCGYKFYCPKWEE
ncbi:MAG: ATP-dependent helicase, partial [Nanoarchaeota archaeon]